MLRKVFVLVAAAATLVGTAAPAPAAPWTTRVHVDAVLSTGGGGSAFVWGNAFATEEGDTHGQVHYHHPYQASYPWALEFRVAVACILVVDETAGPHVYLAGPAKVQSDDRGLFEPDETWAEIEYRAAAQRPFGIRPITPPSGGCSFSNSVAGYLDSGFVTVTYR